MRVLACKIPREIIEKKDGMLLMIYCYISFNRTQRNQLIVYKTHIYEFLNLSSEQQRKSKVEIYRAFKWLVDNNFVTRNKCSKKQSELSRVYDVNIDKFHPSENYTSIYSHEIDKIVFETKCNKNTKYQLVILLLYCRINMSIRSKQTFHIDKNIQAKPQVFFTYHKKLREFLEITDNRVLLKLMNTLRMLELIEYKVLPRFQDKNGNWHTHFTIFADKQKYKWNKFNLEYEVDHEYDFEKEITAAIENITNNYTGKDK